MKAYLYNMNEEDCPWVVALTHVHISSQVFRWFNSKHFKLGGNFCCSNLQRICWLQLAQVHPKGFTKKNLLHFPFYYWAAKACLVVPAWDHSCSQSSHWPARTLLSKLEGCHRRVKKLGCIRYSTLSLQKLHNLTVDKLTQQAWAWVSVLRHEHSTNLVVRHRTSN